MTKAPGPLRRMTNAVVISVLLHLLAFVSILQGYGGKTGSFSIPGIIMIELLPAGGNASSIVASAGPTPFLPESGLNPGAAPGPVPSLDNSGANGSEREPSTRADNSDQLSNGDQLGFHNGQPGTNSAVAPSTGPSAPSLSDPARAPRGQKPPPEPPAPEPASPVARCASCPPPPYPDLALRRGIEGEVTLSVQVLPDGRVGDIFVLKSSGFPFLDEAALTAVKSYTFFPAVGETGPVATTQTVTIPFRLTGP